MDEINDFFDFSKEFKREVVPSGTFTTRAATAASGSSKDAKPVKREYFGNEYASEFIRKEQKLLGMDVDGEDSDSSADEGAAMPLNNLEDNSGDEEVKPKICKIDDGVYAKYIFDSRRDESLPIHDYKDKVVDTVRKNQVCILEGDTGCGKTTQVTQYILDDAYRRKEYCKIVCTQPRRIAAISIAERVCQERKWELGTVVGYQVGLHASMSEDTRILYCTTGVLLQKIIKEKSLTAFTHIILDEVHERDQDMDFLLIVIRRLLRTNSKNVKLLLMSATISSIDFSKYLTFRHVPAPILRVDSRRMFQVREFYLCQLQRINLNNFDVKFDEPNIDKELYQITLKLIIIIDNIEQQEIQLNPNNSSTMKTSILIFLPGINEINEMCKRLDELNASDLNDIKLNPIRLHSLIAPDEQRKVFHRPPPGYRKIILATNIAESSITVPDVKYVIDFCLTKALVTDSATNFSSLQLQWASKANCKQRAGRAGRVMNGRVYRMVSKHIYDNFLQDYGLPEMLRCPLENVVLKAKLLEMGSPPEILALAMSPPNISDIHNTILTLKEVGALYRYVGNVYTIQDGDISFMGRVMASLPLDIRLSRLIILGFMFSCLEDTIIIAAGLSVRSIFKNNTSKVQGEAEAFIQKLIWADGSGSDLFALLKAYRIWASMRDNHGINYTEGEHLWAKRYFINLRSIKEMHLLIQELKERLLHFGIKENVAYQRVHWVDREKTIILKIIICGAFYPNYFIRSNLNDQEQERNIYHILGGNDPCSTVYFTNFNTRFLGSLYTGAVKNLFKVVHIHPKNIDVRFPAGSERIYVSFKSDPDDEADDTSKSLLVPGRTRAEVYKAVRMRFLNMPTILRVMEPKNAVKYAEERGLGVMYEGAWLPTKTTIKHPELIVLPSVFQKIIRGYITHIDNCSKFYFQPLSEQERLREFHELLNNEEEIEGYHFRNATAISKGMIVSAPFDNVYHRAKIVRVITSSRHHLQFKVLFIDYGNTSIVEFSQLRRLSYKTAFLLDIPPRVFECRLAMVHPSSVVSPDGKWVEKAIELLQTFCNNTRVVEVEIYSIENGISNVILKMNNNTMNNLLVEKGFARKSDENYMSQFDHDLRLRKQSVANRFLDEEHLKQNEEYLRTIQPAFDIDVPPPPSELCTKSIKLRGPFSPLETKVFPTMCTGSWQTVQIERESVNSVLLDTDPQDAHERLIVAAGVNETYNTSILTARSTTLMPNIHGFAALMTLLFCPTMQLKCNPYKTNYTAILAGLGYNERTMESLYPVHDIVLNLDVDILKDDLEIINQLRYSMDSMLFTDPGEDLPPMLPKTRANLAAHVKVLLMNLLSKNRVYIETHVDAKDNEWQIMSNDEFATSQFYGKRSLFPLHSIINLKDEKFERMHALAVHCQELHRSRQFDGVFQPTTCRLCNHTIGSIEQLRLHFLTQLHRDREVQIRFKSDY